ncbi:uncharacterized protein Tsen54 isoform X2 [Fopius arisanus]|uniref:Uncharacterized protein Tsen54 isoform X2 n=1 Tax=Fopius arisanus TaxID=64838 RepID=A0A9R1TPC6_9HYME|nr:PREDICTED: uncharacterized protein LOC105272677 isoform X2 [Fopius arisanus]
MTDEKEESLGNRLTAKELLVTRGIRAQAYDEYAKSSLVLPKCGDKLFEPNGSWLQEKQISTNLENMRDLLKIERVNRLSQLAVAEWLPTEKRALVTKRSGVEWTNYGTELNRNLYLIPEEALLLLELNSLELIFNGLSLSIQQAYEILLDSPNSPVTLNEYRVFSQLSRLGYRLQRFHYDKSVRSEDGFHPKKKVIVVPENGQWMTDQKPLKTRPEASATPEKIEVEVKEALKTMINLIDKSQTHETPKTNGNSVDPEDPKNSKSTKLEIVLEETVINPIKIVRTPEHSKGTPKWTASRIQRNVKQLPRRNDNKRKLQITSTSPQSKKPKHEVIDLSDEDIQEIPIVPSRMDLLNQFPNTANNDRIKITTDCIPPNVNPQRMIYQCDKQYLEMINENDKTLRSSVKSDRSVMPYDSSRSYDHRNPGPHWRHNYHQNGHENYQNRGITYNRSFRSEYYSGNWVQRRIDRNSTGTQINSRRWMSYHQVNNLFRGRYNQRSIRITPRVRSSSQGSDAGLYQSSFARVPASSWSEMKQKWREAKIITIHDEDDKMDCSDVELVEENIQPLVGVRHAGSFGDVFERLRIIKSATEKTVRKKKGDYRISYKVFPNNTLHFRKANPGNPLFHIVISSHCKQFPQPVELNRLQQDGNTSSIVFALVSDSTTTYMQVGAVSLPNLSNDYLV